MEITIEQAKQMMKENGGSLDLSGTGITSLPDNLTVGGWLDLSGTGITSLERRNVKKLCQGDYVPGEYLYADGILTHVKNARQIGDYTLYVGKIKGRNVVSDGTNYAHCDKFREGIADLKFKAAADRGSEQFAGLTLDSVVTREEAITMYRIITGACRQGTENFVNNLKELKDTYTIREAIELTKGQYNAERFAEFFGGDK